MTANPIFHLALPEDWERDAPGAYRTSTRGVTLEEEGFIHCSFADQVQATADLYYHDCTDLLLLEIDPDRLTSAVEIENGFPHVYGPIDRDAVVAVTPFGA